MAMTSSEALQSLAVHPDLISTDERRFLDENGYLPLDNVLTKGEVTYLRDRLDKIAESEGDAAGSELHTEEGTVRLGRSAGERGELDVGADDVCDGG